MTEINNLKIKEGLSGELKDAVLRQMQVYFQIWEAELKTKQTKLKHKQTNKL